MIYKNYLIVLELLLKSVKTIYALLRAQAPPLRCVSQYGSRLPLNLLKIICCSLARVHVQIIHPIDAFR